MTFLAPVFLLVAGIAAAGAVLLHLIARDRPPRAPLPTARFVPSRTSLAATWAPHPTDRWLLLLRVLLLLLAGAAFARPVLEPDRRPTVRIVALDRSRAVADAGAARDSAAALLASGGALVLFDSVARIVEGSPLDTLAMLSIDSIGSTHPSDSAAAIHAGGARGLLSAALLAAARAAGAMGDEADSLELVIVSPITAEEIDDATLAIRAEWNGRIRLVRVEAAPSESGERRPIEIRAPANDALSAAFALLGTRAVSESRVRVVRGAVQNEDSSFATSGGVLVAWPGDPALLGWIARAVTDTVGAVMAAERVQGIATGFTPPPHEALLIAPFERRFTAAVSGAAGQNEIVVARWVDGEPAGIEHPMGAGCIREIAIPIEERGDLALRPELGDLLLAVAAPCGGARSFVPASGEIRAALAGSGALRIATRPPPARAAVPPLVPWLLGAALILALLELLLRAVPGRTARPSPS